MKTTRRNGVGSVATEICAKSRKLVGKGLGQDHAGGFHTGGMDEEAALHHDCRNIITRSHEVDSRGDLERVGKFLEGSSVILSANDKVAFLRFAGKFA